MTENNLPIEDPSLRSAVLTAISMYLAEERSELALPPSAGRSLWRSMALKPAPLQPTTWRSVGLAHAHATRLRA